MKQNPNSTPGATGTPRSERTRVLRWPEVQKRTGLCRSHAYDLARKGRFPAPIKIGGRASGWIESEVDAWIEDRISESRKEQQEGAVA